MSGNSVVVSVNYNSSFPGGWEASALQYRIWQQMVVHIYTCRMVWQWHINAKIC